MPLIVHHLQHSQSERVVWLCEELRDLIPGFGYELKLHKRDPVTAQAPEILQELHPAGTAPIIEDTSAKPPLILGESQAIVEYIIRTYGQGCFSIEPGHSEYANYLFWYNFANGSFQACLTRIGTIDLTVKVWKSMRRKRNEAAGRSEAQWNEDGGASDLETVASQFQGRVERHLSMIESRLAQVPYLGGNTLTAADIMTVFSLTTMRGLYPYSLARYVNILRYLGEVSRRSAYQRALERAEPGMEAMIDEKVDMFEYQVFK